MLVVFARLPDMTPGCSELTDASRVQSYGVPALYRVLRFLSGIINPDDVANTKETREFGLRLVNIALETAGGSFGSHPLLLGVIQDDICKQVLQNSQSSHPAILSLTLRIVFNLFHSVKEHLKVQLEVFFTSIHLRLADSTGASFGQKELVLESLVEFCHEPALIVGLYRNYDCEVSSTNLFGDLCKFLSRQALPGGTKGSPSVITSHNTLAMEALLAVLDSIAKRFCDPSYVPEDEGTGFVAEDDFSHGAADKRRIELEAELWNSEGPKALKTIFKDGLNPQAVANFFKTNPALDRYLMGAYLGMPSGFNVAVLNEYVATFNFGSLRIDEALRAFLESFVLPGEAQIIERIMECFSHGYYEANVGGEIASMDSAFILAYSVIMLNTDAHNPNVRYRMDLESWLQNNKGNNEGSDFSPEFLVAIYDSITSTPMVIQSEKVENILETDPIDGGVTVSANGWKRLIHRSAKVGTFKTNAAHGLGKDMFNMIWQEAIHILNFYLESSTNSKVLQRIIEGYHSFSTICNVYGFLEIFNNLVIAVCNSLCEQLEASSDIGRDPQIVFGRNQRAQRLVSLLCNIILGQGSTHEVSLVDAWPNVITVFLWLWYQRLLPDSLIMIEDFRDPCTGDLFSSLRPKNVSHSPVLGQEDVPNPGPVSFISSVFSIWTQEDDDEGEYENEYDDENLRQQALDHLNSCHIEQVFFNPGFFPKESLYRLLDTLMLVSSFASGSLDSSDVQSSVFPESILDDHAAVFCVERLTDIIENNHKRLDGYWTTLHHHFRFVLGSVNAQSPNFFLERVIVNLMRLSVHFAQTENDALDQTLQLIPVILEMNPLILETFGPRIVSGVYYMLKANGKFVVSRSGLDIVRTVLKQLCKVPECGPITVECLAYFIAHFTSEENFSQCSDMLIYFLEHSDGSFPKILECMTILHGRIGRIITKHSAKDVPPKDVNVLLKNLWNSSVTSFCVFYNSRTDLESKILVVDALQMALLTSGVKIKSPGLLRVTFDSILLPQLIEDPQSFEGDVDSKASLKLKVSNLLFQSLMFNMEALSKLEDFPVFWVGFLGTLERFMSPEGDTEDTSLMSHLTQSIHSTLETMQSEGILDIVQNTSGQDLLELSNRFIPLLK